MITVRNGLTAFEAAVACVKAWQDAAEGFASGLYVGDESWGWSPAIVIEEVAERLDRARVFVAEQGLERLRRLDRERNEEAEAEAERAFERRAAFGPGVTVVNVITGERHYTGD